MGMNRVKKCSNCGVEISEEDYYLNEGLCEKCNNENLEEDDKFRNVDVSNEKSVLPDSKRLP
jgi:transcription initiation factor IIE alpha subunit